MQKIVWLLNWERRIRRHATSARKRAISPETVHRWRLKPMVLLLGLTHLFLQFSRHVTTVERRATSLVNALRLQTAMLPSRRHVITAKRTAISRVIAQISPVSELGLAKRSYQIVPRLATIVRWKDMSPVIVQKRWTQPMWTSSNDVIYVKRMDISPETAPTQMRAGSVCEIRHVTTANRRDTLRGTVQRIVGYLEPVILPVLELSGWLVGCIVMFPSWYCI